MTVGRTADLFSLRAVAYSAISSTWRSNSTAILFCDGVHASNRGLLATKRPLSRRADDRVSGWMGAKRSCATARLKVRNGSL